MAKVSYKDLKPELTSDELQEIENAAARTILYDEECPEMTEEMLKQFKRMNQKGRVKQTASIRLSEKAQKFSKSYGKGYTSFFSRLIDAALDDAALVKKCCGRKNRSWWRLPLSPANMRPLRWTVSPPAASAIPPS